MSTLDETRFRACRAITRRVRELREAEGTEVARAICVGGAEGYAAALETFCKPAETAEFFYQIADAIVAREAARIKGEPSSYEP